MRTFIAIDLPAEIKAQVSQLQKQLKDKLPALSWTRPENFHLTLLFLGERTKNELEGIINILDRIPWPGAFTFALDKLELFGTYSRPKVLWLGPGEGREELGKLGGLVRCALGEEEPFAPHLTLARFRNQKPRDIKSILGPVAENILVPVHEVTLFESKFGAGPPRYIPIKKWMLEGDKK